MTNTPSQPQAQPDTKTHRTQQTIIQAALMVFAQLGYHKASTTAIAKQAGMAKATLFYHYPTKKELYVACVSHGAEQMIAELFDNPQIMGIPDIFDKILAFARAKTYFLKRNPEISALILEAFLLSKEPEFDDIAQLMANGRLEVWPYWRQNIDTSLFRPDTDPDTLMNYVYLIMQTLSEQIASTYSSPQDLTDQELERSITAMEQYINLIKYGVYQQPTSEAQPQ